MRLAWGPPVARATGAPESPYAHFADYLDSLEKRRGRARVYRPKCGRMYLRKAAGRLGLEVTGELAGEIAELYGAATPIRLPKDVLGPRLGGLGHAAARVERAGFPDWAERARDAGRLVFIGIVDDAIGFCNEMFRTTTGGGMRSRVDYLWLQGAPHRGGAAPFGREIDRGEIDAALRAHRRGEEVDEGAVYRGLGALDMARRFPQNGHLAHTHGTAVLAAAAGFDARSDPDCARRDRFPIAAVCLPAEVTGDTSGMFAEFYFIAAIQRILGHVDARAAQCGLPPGASFPVIVNLSLALTGGPKDGTSLLDYYLADLQERRGAAAPVKFVFPAGNHRLARTHARMEAEGPREIRWRLPPDDPTPSFLEIWGPRRDARPDAPSFAVSLQAPGGDPAAALPGAPHGASAALVGGGETLGIAYCDWVDESRRERVTIAMAPTGPSAAGATAPPGDWRVGIAPLQDMRWPVQLFIQRDDSIVTYRRRGRQSSFVDDAYAFFEANGGVKLTDEGSASLIRREGSISSFATGPAQVVAGAAMAGRPSPYSALGFGESRPKIVYVPVDRSAVRPGRLAAGSWSGGCWPVSGASMAAALQTRRLAEEISGI